MKKILVDPDPRLRKICSEVTTIDKYIKALVREMQKVISHWNENSNDITVGLAAPQLGELVKLFIIETTSYSLVMMNPVIIKAKHTIRRVEGCLSLPGRHFLVERPKVLKFHGLTLEGQEKSTKLHDSLAQIAMHEIEHLSGIMIDNIALAEIK